MGQDGQPRQSIAASNNPSCCHHTHGSFSFGARARRSSLERLVACGRVRHGIRVTCTRARDSSTHVPPFPPFYGPWPCARCSATSPRRGVAPRRPARWGSGPSPPPAPPCTPSGAPPLRPRPLLLRRRPLPRRPPRGPQRPPPWRGPVCGGGQQRRMLNEEHAAPKKIKTEPVLSSGLWELSSHAPHVIF